MRPAVLVIVCLLSSACSQQESRPAKEAVAQAKGVAADAKETAREAAATVTATAQQAKQTAGNAAIEANRALTNATQAVQQGVNQAADATGNGARHVAHGVAELTEGGVVLGRVSGFSSVRLLLQPESTGPSALRVDGRTRYLLTASEFQHATLPSGTRVRATYVVESEVPVATEVEVLTP